MNKTAEGFAKALSATTKLPIDNEDIQAAAKRLGSHFHNEVVLINCIKKQKEKPRE